MEKRRQRLLLVGWDSADWKIIRPLLNAGEHPGLARLSPFRLPPGAHEMAPGGSRNGLSRARPGNSPELRSGWMIFQSAESQPTSNNLWRRFFIDQAVAAA